MIVPQEQSNTVVSTTMEGGGRVHSQVLIMTPTCASLFKSTRRRSPASMPTNSSVMDPKVAMDVVCCTTKHRIGVVVWQGTCTMITCAGQHVASAMLAA